MRKHMNRLPAVSFLAVLGVLAVSAACRDKSQDQPASREIALTPPATPVEQPPLRDEPPAKAPTTTTKAVTPSKPKPAAPPRSTSPGVPATPIPAPAPPSRPAFAFIPVGTDIAVRPAVKVCTNTQKVGDQVSATIAEAVPGPDGASIPAGATATLEVVESQFGNNDAGKVKLNMRVVAVTFDGNTYDVAGADVIAPPVTKVRRQSNGDQAKKIAIGAAAGAILGRVAGKSKGATVAGGVVGAAGGAVVAGGTADYEGCIAADARLSVKLTQGLRVRVGA